MNSCKQTMSGSTKWFYVDHTGRQVLHCTDGPAVTFSTGEKWWYLNGVEMSEHEHNKYMSVGAKLAST